MNCSLLRGKSKTRTSDFLLLILSCNLAMFVTCTDQSSPPTLSHPHHFPSNVFVLFGIQFSECKVLLPYIFLLNHFCVSPLSNYITIMARHARDRHIPQEVWDGVQKNDSLISQILQLHPLHLHHWTICSLNLLPWKAVAVLVHTHYGLKNCCCLCYLQMTV